MGTPQIQELAVVAVSYWLPILAGHVMIMLVVSWKLFAHVLVKHTACIVYMYAMSQYLQTHSCTYLGATNKTPHITSHNNSTTSQHTCTYPLNVHNTWGLRATRNVVTIALQVQACLGNERAGLLVRS